MTGVLPASFAALIRWGATLAAGWLIAHRWLPGVDQPQFVAAALAAAMLAWSQAQKILAHRAWLQAVAAPAGMAAPQTGKVFSMDFKAAAAWIAANIGRVPPDIQGDFGKLGSDLEAHANTAIEGAAVAAAPALAPEIQAVLPEALDWLEQQAQQRLATIAAAKAALPAAAS